MARFLENYKPKKKKKEETVKKAQSPSVSKQTQNRAKQAQQQKMYGGNPKPQTVRRSATTNNRTNTTTQQRQQTTSQQTQRTIDRLQQKYGVGPSYNRQATRRTQPRNSTISREGQRTVDRLTSKYGQNRVQRDQQEQRRRQERVREAQRQKMGLNNMASKKTQEAANRAIKNTPSLVKKAVQDTAYGHLQNIADVTEMTASNKNGTQAKAMKMGIQDNPEEMRKLEQRQQQTVEKAKLDREKWAKEQDERQKAWDKKVNGATGAEKAYYGAVESGTGMLTDLALGLGTQGGSLAAMFSRTRGQVRGQAEKEGATEAEDRTYATWQALKEVGTELMFPGAGLAKGYAKKTGIPIAERIANNLTKRMANRTAADIAGAGVRLLGGTAEENAEELAGWGLDPLIKEFSYGRNVRTRQKMADLQTESDELRSSIQSEDDARRVASYLNSSEWLDQNKQQYMEAGLSEKKAEEVAEKMRDYMTASLTGDTKTMEALEKDIASTLSKGEFSYGKNLDKAELLDTFASTTLLTMTTGLPATATTAMRGSVIRDNLGNDGIRTLAESAMNYEDAEASKRGEVARDRINAGKELTASQVYELAAAQAQQVEKDTRRVVAKNNVVADTLESEKLVAPMIMRDDKGNLQGDTVITQRYNDSAQEAENVLKDIDKEQKLSLSDSELAVGSRAIAGFQTGAFTINDANALNYTNTAVRDAFEKVTGVDLGQYVVKTSSGAVDYAATNAATKDALFTMAADNFIETARAETENFKDITKGITKEQMAQRIGSEGDKAMTVALSTVDPADEDTYGLMESAAQNVYEYGRYTEDSWDDVSANLSEMYPGLSQDALQDVYEAAKRDKTIAENPYYNAKITAGESTRKMDMSEAGQTEYGKFTNDTGEDIGMKERAVLESIASEFGINIRLLPSEFFEYKYVDRNGKEKTAYSNGSYDPKTGTMLLNGGNDMDRNIIAVALHEITHHIAIYAPDEYLALSNRVMEAWYKNDADAFSAAIQRKQDSYKAQVGQNLSEEQALEEVIADAMGEMSSDPDFISQICTEEPSLAEQIINAIRSVMRKLRAILASGNVAEEHEDAFFSQLNMWDEAQRLWLEAAKVAQQQRANQMIDDWDANARETASEETERRYSINDDYAAFKDYIMNRKESSARWTENRIDSLIKEYGASNPDYSQAYAVLMNPRDFLKLTLADSKLDKWNNYAREEEPEELRGLSYAEATDVKQQKIERGEYYNDFLESVHALDENELRSNEQTPFLTIYSNDGTEVQGHEGRHRMRALMEAGIKSVPVVIRDSDTKYSKVPTESMTLSSQDFGYDPVNNGATVEVKGLIPIKESNRDELIQKFGGDAQVRFSLNEPVERVADLIAVHNLKPDDIRNTFDLGGFPMPSIAVTKDSMGHDLYGDITLMFNSDTIDPGTSRSNQVFGGDAWTPTFPSIAKKVSRQVADRVDQRLRDILGLGRNDYTLGDLRLPSLDDDNLTNALRYNEPYDAFKNDEVFQIAYLKDAKNFDVAIPTKEGRIRNLDKEALEYLDDRLPELTYDDIYNTVDRTMEFEPAVRQARKDYYESKGDIKLKSLAKHLDEEMGYSDVIARLEATIKYREEGIPEVTDRDALRDKLNEEVDQEGFKAWIDNLFEGIIEKTGIRNNKDMFTPSGNRRSWEALHDPVTLENVVKVMKSELAAGGNGLFGSNPKGAAQKQYKSLDEIRDDEDRLQKLSEEEYKAQSEVAVGKMSEVCTSIAEHNPGRFSSSFGAALDVGSYVAEILNSTRNKATIKRKLTADYNLDVTDEQMNDLMDAIDAIANLPTGYFEAKPRRAVGFDEVKAAVIPASTEEDIKQGLSDRGIQMYEYDPDVEGDRTEKVNEAATAQDLRFSITDSEGNELSAGQAEFFRDSKMVNSEGKLMPMYHGTQNEFYEFDITKAYPGTLGRGFYFTDSETHSGTYGKSYKYYLNLLNPLMPETNNITKDQLRRFVSELADNEDYGIENYGYGATVDSVTNDVWGKSDFRMLHDLNLSCVGDLAEAVKVFNRVNDTDYDGIITTTETLAFYPEQVKSTDNLNPTLSKDTRYSITDSDGNELSDGQVQYFRNSQARDEQGRLVPVYHTTNKGGFTIFDPSRSDDHRSLFFASNWDVSQTYGNYANSRFYQFEINDLNDVEKYLDAYGPDFYVLTKDEFERAGGYEADFVDFENEGPQYRYDAIQKKWKSSNRPSETRTFLFNSYIEDVENGDINPADYVVIVGVPDYSPAGDSFADTWVSANSPEELVRELRNYLLAQQTSYSGESTAGKLHGYYQCYLNLENPMIIDAKGQYWDSIKEDGFEQVSVLKIGNSFDVVADGTPISFSRVRELYGDAMADQIEKFDGWESGEYHDFYTWNGAAYDPEEKGHWPMEGNTRFWAREAEAQGYDGVIFRNLRDIGGASEFDGWNEFSDIFIAFSSNQVKDTRNENPTENPDIRYSISDDEEAQSKMAYDDAMDTSYEALAYYETLMDESEEQIELYADSFSEEKINDFYAGLNSYTEYFVFDDPVLEEGRKRMARSRNDFMERLNAEWNERWLTDGEVLDLRSVRKEVRQLVMGVMRNSDTSRQYKTETVNKTLIDIRLAYQFAKKGRTEVADALLWHSALRMIEDVEFINDDTFQQYKDLRDYLRTTRIQLGEEYWSDVDYTAFRKNNYGRMKLVKGETNVDQIYQEMCERWPEWFDEEEDMTPPDQLLQIEHVLDVIQPYKEAYSSEEAASIATDIAYDLSDIVYGKGKPYESIADKYKNRYDKQTKALKQRHKEALRKVREQRNKGIKAERAKWQVKEQRRKERQAHKKAFDSIVKNYNWLSERLLTNTKDKHIPEQYKKELAGLLAAFDLQTVGSKKVEERRGQKGKKTIRMEAMKKAISNIEARSEFFHLNDSITDIIDELLGREGDGSYNEAMSIEGKTIDELSVDELKKIDKLLKALKHEFTFYETVRTGAKRTQAADIGSAQVDSALKHAELFGPGKDYNNFLGAVDKIVNMDEMTPAYLFKRIDPKNTGLGMMFKELRRSFDKYVKNQEQLNGWMEEILSPYHRGGKLWKKYGAEEIENWRLAKATNTFKLQNGDEIRLTPAQMMSLYCLSKRPQAYQHMVGAGIVVKPVSFQAKLETDLKRKTNWALPTILTDGDIKMICTSLTPDQKKVADQLQQLMATKMAAWGNEASRSVIGIDLFEDPDYFPIQSDKAALEEDFTADQFVDMIRNFGFTKAVQPGARNAIAIDDIFTVVSTHCNNMNLYNAYSESMNDFMKVYNYHALREDGSDYSVKQAVAHAYSQKATTFISSFMRDLNGNVSKGRVTGIENMMNAALGNAKKASVFANGRVALQQPTAIMRAFAVIAPKYLKGVKIEKGAMQEMFEHCPIALWKSWGYYDINMGKSIEDIMMNNGKWLEDKMTDIYGAADNVTWTAIWQMCKAEIREKHPNVKEGSDEFWDLCNERMTEVVDLTQVVDSPFHRSHAMRDKQILTKMATSFMAEPTLTFNMVRDGFVNAIEMLKSGDKAGAAKLAGKTSSVFVLSTFTTAAFAAVWDVVRGKQPDGDDDDDGTAIGLWWANTLANFEDNLKLWNDVYYIKDISSLFDGWGTSNLALQGWKQFADGYAQLTGTRKVSSNKSWWENMLAGIGYLSGKPFGTILKDGNAVLNIIGVHPAFLSDIGDRLDSVQDMLGGSSAGSGTGKTSSNNSSNNKKSGSDESDKVSSAVRLWTYSDAPFRVQDGSIVDNFLNHFGVNLTSAEIEAAEAKQAQKEHDKKVKEITNSLSEYSGEEYDKKLWDKSDLEGYGKALEKGDFERAEEIENLFLDCGGSREFLNNKKLYHYKKNYVKTIVYDPTDAQIEQQTRMKDFLLSHGMTESELSEKVYKSQTTKELKVAFRLNDEDAIVEELTPLIRAGLSYDDFVKAYKNRNRIDLKEYKDSDGKYAERLKSTGVYNWPVNGTITSNFDEVSSIRNGRPHAGLDIAAGMGTPVGAADGGTVVFAGWDGGFGKCVRVQHDDGTITEYAHLSWWDCKVGDSVAQGQTIGNVGSTGHSTGPHLHFGVKVNGSYVDPLTKLN